MGLTGKKEEIEHLTRQATATAMNASKQKMWLKFINRAKDPMKQINDQLLANNLAQVLGVPLMYINERVCNGEWKLDCKLTDILTVTGTGTKKKEAKANAASALIKLVLERHDNEDTKFLF